MPLSISVSADSINLLKTKIRFHLLYEVLLNLFLEVITSFSELALPFRVLRMWLGFPGGWAVKNPAKSGDSGSISGLKRSPGEGNGNPLQYSCLGSPMDRRAWQVQSMGLQEVRHDLVTKQQQQNYG